MEPRKIALGIDAGTHGIRILSVDAESLTVLQNIQESYVRHVAGGVQELDAADVTAALYSALGRLRLQSGDRIAAAGITHQRGTVLPVDVQGKAVHPALCDSDTRAVLGDEFAAAGFDPVRYYEESGCPVVSFNGFTKVLWCREHMPEIMEKTETFLSLQDYLLGILCGKAVFTEGSLLRNGMLDIRTRGAHEGNLKKLGLPVPETVPLGGEAGRASQETVRAFPFLKDTIFYAVPGDQPAAVIGSGAFADNVPAMNLGTTFVMSILSGQPLASADGLVTTEVLPGCYSPEFGTGAGGQFMDFLMGILSGGNSLVDWKKTNEEAAGVKAGAEGLRIVPLLWQATSSGVEGSILGLMPQHTPAHFVRAAYEGLAFEAALSAEKMRRAAGEAHIPFDMKALRVFGGLTESDIFLQILSCVLGVPVEAAAQKQASAYGAALLSAQEFRKTTGAGDALPAAPVRIFTPDREEEKYYEQAFAVYCDRR